MSTYILIILSLLYANVLATYETIEPGVFYQHLVINNPKQSIHVLIADPQQIDITFDTAHGICADSEKTSMISKRHNAIAAINGGFFDFGSKTRLQEYITTFLDCIGYSSYTAFPIYALQGKDKYYAMSHPFTGFIGWSNDHKKPVFGTIKTSIELLINGKSYPVFELNKPHQTKPSLYSDCYDKKTPYHAQKADEITIQDNKIVAIFRSSLGKIPISEHSFVYVVPKAYNALLQDVQEGDQVMLKITHEPGAYTSHDDVDSQEYIVASTPLLIAQGEIVPDLQDRHSTFYTHKHPRTAVGVLENGSWVFVVIDGRQKQSEGFTIRELADYMKELGCVSALNLDGGGSSTMVIHGKIVNSPSGRKYSLFRKERPISNALLITSKKS